MIRQSINSYKDRIDDNVEHLVINNTDMKILPRLNHLKRLKVLNCCYNSLKIVCNLPDNLEELYCINNEIKFLECPRNLKILWCSNNKIKNLKNLPDTLDIVYCSYNLIEKISNIPENIKELILSCNNLQDLPELNDSIKILNTGLNYLENISLPDGILSADIGNNNISSVNIPSSLEDLDVSSTKIKHFGKEFSGLRCLCVPNDVQFISPLIKGYVYTKDFDIDIVESIQMKSKLVLLSYFFQRYCNLKNNQHNN